MNAHADDGFDPMPNRIHLVGETAWIGLDHLAADFSAGGVGRIVSVNTANDELTNTIDLDGLQNCADLAPSPDGGGLWVLCGGVFGADQLANSGLAWVPFQGDPTLVKADTFAANPLGFSVVALSDDAAFFVEFGNFDPAASEKVWHYTTAGGAADTGVSSGAYTLGTLALSADSTTLFVPDGNAEAPTVRRYDIASGEESEAVDTNPSVGLPPRSIASFR